MITTPRNPFEFLIKYDDDSMIQDILNDAPEFKSLKTSINLGIDENAIIDTFQSPEIKEMLGSNRTEIMPSLMRIGFDFIVSHGANNSTVSVNYKGEQKNISMSHFLMATFHAHRHISSYEPDEKVYDFQSAFEFYVSVYVELSEKKKGGKK